MKQNPTIIIDFTTPPLTTLQDPYPQSSQTHGSQILECLFPQILTKHKLITLKPANIVAC